MRLPQLVKAGEELYEVVYKCSVNKFSVEITGGNVELLKQFYGAEKILRNPQTNEYLFVNLIPEVETISND
jgi:hypothetical protein